MPTTPTSPDPERRAAAAGRCTPRHSRGTLKDSRCRTEPSGACCSAAGLRVSDGLQEMQEKLGLWPHLLPVGPDSRHHRPMSAREQRKA